MKKTLIAASLITAVVGCAAGDSRDMKVTPVSSIQPQMVNGTASPTSQDSVVMIAMGQSFCAATFIAPDLLITAHHCVAQETDSPPCSPLGATLDPSAFEVKLNQPGSGTNQDFEQGTTVNSPTVAHGVQVWVSSTNNICSYDIALIKLDTAVPNAKISNLRFSALAANEAVTAVGFGDDGQGDYPNVRQERSTNVLGVGPTTVQFQSGSDGTIPLSLPNGDVMTGESHCFGDSGGPLFDKDGNIVAIISRGPDDAPSDVQQRGQENCIGMAETYAGVAFNEALIREAVKEAGHDLSAGSIGSTQNILTTADTTATAPPTTTQTKEVTGDDDDDDSSATTTKKKKTTSATSALDPVASSSCTAVPGRAHGTYSWALIGLAAALVTGARRRRLATGSRNSALNLSPSTASPLR